MESSAIIRDNGIDSGTSIKEYRDAFVMAID